MTPARKAKAAGIKSLDTVAAILGGSTRADRARIKRRLNNWSRTLPRWLEVTLQGCRQVIDTETDQAPHKAVLVGELALQLGYSDVTQLTTANQLFEDAQLYDFTARNGAMLGLFRVTDGQARLIATYVGDLDV